MSRSATPASFADRLVARVARARTRRRLHVTVAVLRLMIGFAFLPAGLKKVLGQPFTDPGNSGPFHDFLHAFHDTGGFYRFVGALQLVAALLLLTQRFAGFGALLMLPILVAITVFCWSTWVVPTASVVTLMLLAISALLLWDAARWRAVFAPAGQRLQVDLPGPHPEIAPRYWERCGLAIALLYLGNTVITGEVYRPRGAEWGNPSFIVLVAIALSPVVTHVLERRRARTQRVTT